MIYVKGIFNASDTSLAMRYDYDIWTAKNWVSEFDYALYRIIWPTAEEIFGIIKV